MAEAKTQLTGESLTAFFKRATADERRTDCVTLARMMKASSGKPGAMWGRSIVGFGSQPIQHANGKTSEWPLIAFSPRKSDLTLYVGRGAAGFDALLAKLGKHKMAGGCLHIKRLSDVDTRVLATLLSATVRARKKKQA